MLILVHVHLSPTFPNERVWFLTSSTMLLINSSNRVFVPINSRFFVPANFIQKAKTPPKVKMFAWLVASRKVNFNDSLWMKRPYKALSSEWCVMCKKSEESLDFFYFLFLHCLIALALGHRLFGLIRFRLGVWWMVTISYKGFGDLLKGKPH